MFVIEVVDWIFGLEEQNLFYLSAELTHPSTEKSDYERQHYFVIRLLRLFHNRISRIRNILS